MLVFCLPVYNMGTLMPTMQSVCVCVHKHVEMKMYVKWPVGHYDLPNGMISSAVLYHFLARFQAWAVGSLIWFTV